LRDSVTIGDLPRLTRALDRTLLRWGSAESEPPVWVTEHGYQTRPPDPYSKVTQRRQALWITQADFFAYLNPRVASVSQFLLYDDRPRRKYRRNRKRRKTYWGTWQSGLLTADGARKPAYEAYRLPLWVTPARAADGAPVRVWAQYRPGRPGARLLAEVEFLARGSDSWEPLTEKFVSNEGGTLDLRVVVPGSGAIRVAWNDATEDRRQYSRAAGIQVSR
jgi:hypothetical protein